MSDLDRLIALAGLATDDVAEGAYDETKMICKDCGDELHKPTTNCEHDSHDENGDNWVEVDIDGDGDADLAVNMEAEKKNCGCGQDPCITYGKKNEAVGESAEIFYEMQDMYAGGECPSKPHETIIDELVRHMSADQLEDFVMDFRRHHMDLGDEMFQDDVNEDDLDENAFNQAAAAAARAGKEEFEFNGKTYKTKMDKSTAHKLDDDVQMESLSSDAKQFMSYAMELAQDKLDYIKSTGKFSFTDSDQMEYYDELDMDEDEELIEHPMVQQVLKAIPQVDGSEEEIMRALKNVASGNFEPFEELRDSMGEEVVAEAPTMDTTQLITLLKNAGLTEEAIQEKLTEWANTPSPEMANEQEPTEHGDAYDFAQSVNLSLKRYLDAEDMKVGLKEHKVEDLREAYESTKKMPLKAEVMKCCEDGMTVEEICEKYKDCDKEKMKLMASSCMKEYKSK